MEKNKNKNISVYVIFLRHEFRQFFFVGKLVETRKLVGGSDKGPTQKKKNLSEAPTGFRQPIFLMFPILSLCVFHFFLFHFWSVAKKQKTCVRQNHTLEILVEKSCRKVVGKTRFCDKSHTH